MNLNLGGANKSRGLAIRMHHQLIDLLLPMKMLNGASLSLGLATTVMKHYVSRFVPPIGRYSFQNHFTFSSGTVWFERWVCVKDVWRHSSETPLSSSLMPGTA
jgi:hypothetical protein